MSQLQEAARDFLAQKNLAVAGVSRDPDQPGSLIYKKLRETGHHVIAINPRRQDVDGAPCYPDLASVPEPIDGVVAATPPEGTEELVRACAELGIPRLWMHRSFGGGSVSEEAVAYGREHGVTVIPGACPMMFCEPVDFGHKCIRFLVKMTGGLPEPVEPAS